MAWTNSAGRTGEVEGVLRVWDVIIRRDTTLNWKQAPLTLQC